MHRNENSIKVAAIPEIERYQQVVEGAENDFTNDTQRFTQWHRSLGEPSGWSHISNWIR